LLNVALVVVRRVPMCSTDGAPCAWELMAVCEPRQSPLGRSTPGRGPPLRREANVVQGRSRHLIDERTALQRLSVLCCWSPPSRLSWRKDSSLGALAAATVLLYPLLLPCASACESVHERIHVGSLGYSTSTCCGLTNSSWHHHDKDVDYHTAWTRGPHVSTQAPPMSHRHSRFIAAAGVPRQLTHASHRHPPPQHSGSRSEVCSIGCISSIVVQGYIRGALVTLSGATNTSQQAPQVITGVDCYAFLEATAAHTLPCSAPN